MALVTCPECGHSVSDRAPACPQCGNPMGVQTIQQTGKGWKALMLLSAVLACVGTAGVVAGSGMNADPQTTAVFVVLIFAGLSGFVAARIGAWWFHG